MKKIIFLFLILFTISHVSAVYALTLDNCLSKNNTCKYDSSYTNDLNITYNLHSSDTLKKSNLYFDIYNFPQTIIINYYDNQNNVISVNAEYTLIDNIIVYNVKRKIIVFYNKVPQNLKSSLLNKKDKVNYEFNTSTILFKDLLGNNVFYSKNVFVAFSGNQVIIPTDESFITTDRYIELQNDFYPTKIEISNYNSYLNYSQVTIDYIDANIPKVISTIDGKYDKLHFVFQFIFLIFKAILFLLNAVTFGMISEKDFYSYQLSIIEPLTYLDLGLKSFLWVLKFFSIMGIFFTIAFIETIIFIYSFTQSRDILETFERFINYSKDFFTIVIINPLIWIYENLILKVIEMIKP